MDYEYDHDEYGPRVLWGRLIFFAVALLLVFLVGRCAGVRSAGGSQDEELANRVQELASDKIRLQDELAAAQATQNEPTTNNGQGDTVTEATEGPTEGEQNAVEEGDTYTVESGDTLTLIAEKEYGDQGKWRLIADANNLDSTTPLTVGQELVIPPDEE